MIVYDDTKKDLEDITHIKWVFQYTILGTYLNVFFLVLKSQSSHCTPPTNAHLHASAHINSLCIVETSTLHQWYNEHHKPMTSINLSTNDFHFSQLTKMSLFIIVSLITRHL